MKRRYCFFNVDGLLNKSSEWNEPFVLNKALAELFAIFLLKYNLIPVIASSWRFGFEGAGNEKNAPYIKELEEIFRRYGLVIYDKTPFLKGRPRNKEIERFLYFNRANNYIVIDGDREEYEKINDHVIFIDPKTGFTPKAAKIAGKLITKLDRKMAG
ncbi:MAG: hypothetical protein K6F73_09230 [Lachnospiraceae bacterium]|nr:hypothetical protein [Lachnospiraceae bacterium]